MLALVLIAQVSCLAVSSTQVPTGRVDDRLPRFLDGTRAVGSHRRWQDRHRVGEDPPEVVTSLGTIVGRRRPDERPNVTAFEAECECELLNVHMWYCTPNV